MKKGKRKKIMDSAEKRTIRQLCLHIETTTTEDFHYNDP